MPPLQSEKGLPWPAIVAVCLFLAQLVISMLVTTTYQPIMKELHALRHDFTDMRADPSSKPETRVELAAIRDRLASMEKFNERLEARHERLEERVNNMHSFILQGGATRPPSPLFQRRGEDTTSPIVRKPL